MTEEPEKLSYSLLVDRVRTSGHLADMLRGLQPGAMLVLLRQTGLQDALAMQNKPGRIAIYIKANQRKLINVLDQEEPAADTVRLWLKSQLLDLDGSDQDDTASETEGTDLLTAQWVQSDEWWKAALLYGHLCLERTDDAGFDASPQAGRILSLFAVVDQGAALETIGQLQTYFADDEQRSELDWLLAESQRLAEALASLSTRLASREALPAEAELDNLFEALHDLIDEFSALQRTLSEQTADLPLPEGMIHPNECQSLDQLSETYEHVSAALAEHERQQRDVMLDQTVSMLRSILNLARVDGVAMPKLDVVKKEARSLLDTAQATPHDPETAAELSNLRDGTHPFAVLLRVVSDEVHDDDELFSADATLGEAFGRKLALIAATGRLAIQAPLTSDEAEDAPTVTPDPAGPESPVEELGDLAPDARPAEEGDLPDGPGKADLPDPAGESPAETDGLATVPDDEDAEGTSDVEPADSHPGSHLPEAGSPEVSVISQGPPPQTPIDEPEAAPVPAEQHDVCERDYDYFCQFVRSDDIPGAYWLARSWEAQGKDSVVPSWLLAAVQGSRWLHHAQDRIVDDLTEITQYNEPEPDLVSRLYGIAAALVPALIAPTTGLGHWLGASGPPSLVQITEAVDSYASHGYALRPEDLLGVSGQAQLATTLKEVCQQAARWIQEAPSRRIYFRRANDVWRRWVGPKGELRQILRPVARNNQDVVDKVRTAIEDWLDDSTASRMQTTDTALHGRHGRPIVGSPRNKLINDTDEALQLAREWCELVKRLRDVQSRGDWFLEQMQQLVEGVREGMPQAKTWLRQLADDAHAEPAGTAAVVLLLTLGRLSTMLKLTDSETNIGDTLAGSRPSDSRTSLRDALARRLLLLSDTDLEDNMQPTPGALLSLDQDLVKAKEEGRNSREAFEAWIARQDYRFCSSLLADLGDEPDAVDLSRRWQEAQSGSRDSLGVAIREASDAIQQGVIDATIVEDEKAAFDARVEGVKQAEVTGNYGPLYQRLELMHDALGEARTRRLAHQRDRWNEILGRLETTALDPNQRDRIAVSVEEALKRGDTVVLDEWLASLAGSMDRGERPDVSHFVSSASQRDAFEEFRSVQPRLNEILSEKNLNGVASMVRTGRTGALIPRQLPRPRLEEASRAIRAWRELKRHKTYDGLNMDHLCAVLRFLGFSITSPPSECARVRQGGTDWIYLQVDMSASNLAPIPQFGSLQEGNYSVVCVWERPALDTIGALLHNLKLRNDHVLVLYFGRIKTNQRKDMRRFTRSNSLGAVIVDEILLVFLARERESRLPTFLACTLPLAHVNPYVATGVVMPEMFFGREEMIQSLASPSGAALVYGGRQLGKSALLRRVAREFHRPDREQYALYVDIKLVGDPTSGQNYEELLWRRLRDGLSTLGLLNKRAQKATSILRKVREAMDTVPHRRVLVLLDEADRFLQADEGQSFRIVSDLKRIMDATDRRFKVVFAGLHDVQRFQSIPNQPLAHLPSLRVGPLEPQAAQQLIRYPLEALGFTFADSRPILRILAYTNYHPGLIQLFCGELVDLLREQSAMNPDFRVIEHTHIEQVYRQDRVRDEMRKRFDWTLALDRRYKAIAYSVVHDQMEDRDGYARAYSLAEVLEFGRYWWSKGFEGVARDQFEGILREMCGLGVLVRHTHDHRYRLRSPNLVRLMGTQQDIEDTLLELSDKEPEVDTIIPNSHHAPLDENARRYSPFTYAQSSILNDRSYGVALVFGSEALGLSSVPDATRRFIPASETGVTDDRWEELRYAGNSGGSMEQSLRKFLGQHDDTQRLIALRHMAGSPQQLAEQVEAALNFCRQHERRRRQWMRVILVFDPLSAWEWLSLATDQRADLEDRADATVWLSRWDAVGLRQRLDQRGRMSSEEDCTRLLSRTGGWRWLLDQVSECWTDRADDPLEGTDSLWRSLKQADSSLGEQFLQVLGLDTAPAAEETLRFIASNASVPADYILLEMTDDQHGLTEQECRIAVEFLRNLAMIDVHRNAQTQEDEVRAEPVVKTLLGTSGAE